MASEQYAASIETARTLITKFGRQDGVLRRPNADETVPDPDQPWKRGDADPTEDPIVLQQFPVVVLDASLFKEELTPASKAVAYVAVHGVVPQLGDILETRGERHSVLHSVDLAPGPDSLIFILHLGT